MNEKSESTFLHGSLYRLIFKGIFLIAFYVGMNIYLTHSNIFRKEKNTFLYDYFNHFPVFQLLCKKEYLLE